MDARTDSAPPCPLTGAPPRRRLQWISANLLADLWRFSMGIDVSDQFAGIDRLGLWESPTGLLYFDPPLAGDQSFYQRFYRRMGMHQRVAGPTIVREEFVRAAAHVSPGDKVLDVGCGEGGFSRYVANARYTGLDLHFGGSQPNLLAETIETHAAAHPGRYDVVCAFQVLEHVPDPVGFAAAMSTALRPSGRLLIGVPRWPSPMTRIPNFVLNAPPHHLTLWTPESLAALCARLGIACRSVDPIRFGKDTSLTYWMWRLTPKFRSEQLFRHAWSWHAGLLWCYGAGRLLDALRSVPSAAEPPCLLLVAEKPA
jgi:SAM-dependent methyltransferase